MRKLLLLTSMLLCLCCLSCESKYKFKLEKRFTEHFPKKMENYILGYEATIKLPIEYEQSGIRFKEVYRYRGEIKKIADNLSKSAIDSVAISDSCIIILPKVYQHVEVDEPIVNSCDGGFYMVIPNLDNFKNRFGITDFTDFTYYILSAEQGIFYDKERLFDPSIMPSSWSNGYTKGLAISEEDGLVIFWIEIW